MAMNRGRNAGRLRIGLRVTFQVVLVAALVAGVNVLASRNPVPGLRGDWTADNRNTLHPATANLLASVQDPVDLILFHSSVTETHPRQRAFFREVHRKTDLLVREAGYLSRRIRVESIDPTTHPDRAVAALTRSGLDSGAAVGSFLLVHSRGRNIQLPFRQLATVDRETGQFRYQGEDVLYKAVAEVTRREERMVTFVQGHGELDPTRPEQGLALTTLLDREAYRIGRVDVTRGETIPPSTSVLVIARPLKEFTREEVAAVADYHRKGGNVLLLIGARTPARNLRQYLEVQFKLALRPENEMIYDPKGALPRYPEWIVVDRAFHATHPITRPLARAQQRVAVVLPRVRPLTLKAPDVCTYLLETHRGAWPDRYKPGNYARRLDPDEKVHDYEKNPFPIGVAVDPSIPSQRVSGENAGRLVLFCSGEFASAQFLNNRTANASLLVNAVHWLSGKDAGERIAPVALRDARLTLAASDDRLLFWVVVVLPSAVMLALGMLVFLLRRGG